VPELVCFRAAAFPLPLWSVANPRPGRFNAPGDGAIQYLSLHPLGPFAELARHHGIRELDRLREVRSRVWALRVPLEAPVELSFASARGHGLSAQQLVDDDQGPCRALGRRLRAGAAEGAFYPSAALPGTVNLVLFGRRVLAPYQAEPIDLSDVPGSVAGEDARPVDGLSGLIRHRGEAHVALESYLAGDEFVFMEPALNG
jgi:RES domain-containing protein